MIIITLPKELETDLIRWREATEGLSSPLPVIRSLAIVGGEFEEYSSRELGVVDTMYLKHAFNIMAQKGIPVAPDLRIGVINLQYGHNFKTHPANVDAVLLANIFHYNENVWGGLKSQNLDEERAKAGWHKPLVESGARYVFNYHQRDELCSPLHNSLIEGGPFGAAEEIRIRNSEMLGMALGFLHR